MTGRAVVTVSRRKWRALCALTAMGLVLAAAGILFTVVWVGVSDHKFCQVIGGFTATSVQRPADPAANPSRETSYLWYERFVSLDRALGC